MFDKFYKSLYAKLFPCHNGIIKLLDLHSEAVSNGIAARERLQAACQQGQVCYNATLKQQAK